MVNCYFPKNEHCSTVHPPCFFYSDIDTLPPSGSISAPSLWTQAELCDCVTTIRSKAVWLLILGYKNAPFFYLILLGHLLYKLRHLDIRRAKKKPLKSSKRGDPYREGPTQSPVSSCWQPTSNCQPCETAILEVNHLMSSWTDATWNRDKPFSLSPAQMKDSALNRGDCFKPLRVFVCVFFFFW